MPNDEPAKPTQKHSRGSGHIWVVAALLLLAAVAIGTILRARLQPNLGYITAPVLRKDLVQTVTATGTVNPQNTILVGSEVSGTISELDADFNSVLTSSPPFKDEDSSSVSTLAGSSPELASEEV